MTDETYQGWTNRETWAVALHINNDQGWQESVHEALREWRSATTQYDTRFRQIEAGAIIRENVVQVLEPFHIDEHGAPYELTEDQWLALQDIGSFWRVNWTELGAAFLSDLEDES